MPVIEAALHVLIGNRMQPPRGVFPRGRVVREVARLEHQVAVVVVDHRFGDARLVADRGNPVERRHGGMDPPLDAVGQVLVRVGDVGAGRVAPDAIQHEQIAVRKTIRRTFLAAAAGNGRGVRFLLGPFRVGEQIQPGRVVRCEAPVRRRTQKTIVIVVGRIVHAPAAPRERIAAPLRGLGMPNVPHRLFGVGCPARALIGS